GVVSTPIDVMRLFEAAGAAELLRNGRLAVRGFDGLGEQGAAFLGRPERFDSDSSLRTPVIALDGRWQLAMQPSEPGRAAVWMSRATRFGSVLLGLLVIWLVLRWQTQQRRLVESERLLRDVNTHVNDVVFRADTQGRLLYLNPAYERLTGRRGRHLLGASWLNLFSESERRRVRFAFKRSRDAGGRLVMTSRLARQNAASLPVEIRVDVVPTRSGADAGLVGTVSDQSERHAFEQLEELATAVFEGAGDAIVILDRHRRVLAANPAFERMVGMPGAELSGQRLRVPEVISPTRQWLAQVARHLKYRDRWQEEVASRLPGGKRRVLNWSLDAVRDERGRVSRYVAVITDVTRRHQRMEAMHHRAHHDPLTDLLNRAGLEERFEQARLHALREGDGIVLAFIDLNDFKPINDTHGHHVGDEVLREIASRLRAIGRREDIVARLGGDEFVVVFYDVRSSEAMSGLGATLRERIGAPILLRGMDQPLKVRASIGFARLSIDADTLDGLLRHADKAMYEVKFGAPACPVARGPDGEGQDGQRQGTRPEIDDVT
ncbi:MAG: diguanylate cyclase domain-containing protein, partial [Guyparkeria sp.]|uniref:diguanylate cyclase domain-containing protein n=1 Tax=Guyparkeria sp. TaxID=2035736 RepID=UPI00397E7D40